MKPALLCAALALSTLPFAHAQGLGQKTYRDAEQAFLERSSLKAADEKCSYFTELERSALTSGQLQARGELLRSGQFTRDAIDAAEAEITYYANTRPCGDPDFMAARAHLKDAFLAFIGTMVMDYPGNSSVWQASRSRWDSWRLVQNGASDDWLFEFGLLAPDLSNPDDFPASFSRPLDAPLWEEPFSLAVELILPEGELTPAMARLLVRDPVKAPEPWLGRLFDDDITPPPMGLTRVFWSSGRTIETDESTGEDIVRFTFSPEAIAAIETLDPRELFQIAITPHPRSGRREKDFLTIETGDFAAAHAFTKLPPL